MKRITTEQDGSAATASVESREQKTEWPMTDFHRQAARPKADNDEIRDPAQEFEEASPFRMTRTPQPKATHPGMFPMQTPTNLPAVALDGFVIPNANDFKALHELWVTVNHEFRVATARKQQRERRIAWEKIKLLRPHMNAMNRGTAEPLKDSDLNKAVGVAAALHESPASQYQKWEYEARSNWNMANLLKAYDELRAKTAALKLENFDLRERLEFDNQIIDSLLEKSPEEKAETI